MKKISILLLMAMALPLCAQAPAGRNVNGVNFPAFITRGGKDLPLNGAGIRKKVVFKVYAAGLYAEKPSRDGAELASSEQDKVMELVFLRDVGGFAVSEAIERGFEKNSAGSLPLLKQRMETLRGLIPDVKKGDRLVFAYKAGKAVEVEANGKKRGELDGGDFAAALFRCWLGDVPADKELKKGLLGE